MLLYLNIIIKYGGILKMDFADQLKLFTKRVDTIKETITTEEATKASIIMPFSLY